MTYVNKKAILKFVVIIILGVVVASATMSSGVMADAPAESAYSDILNDTYGEGTSSNPYFVTTVDELQAVNSNLSAHYVLGKNIDASETENWNSGAGFTPIGPPGVKFSGSFDGQRHTVDGLYINRPNTNAVGLFGRAKTTIKNIGVTNLDIQGDNNVGGLVGYTRGANITNSFSSGVVSGDISVGGLVGNSYGSTNITNSYSNSNVSGISYVAGLVGNNRGLSYITKSYSVGSVTGDNNAGGLTGSNSATSTVTDSYWNTETSTQSTSAGSATGLTTSEMTGLAAMNMVGLDFASEWKTVSADDYDSSADSYPILYSVDTQAQLVSADVYEATYTVNVLVEDSGGNAISGANVEIDGKSGGYLPNGTYTISASADGYDSLSQDVTVDGADKTVTVTLFESTYSVDVLVEDSGGNAISGANVEIDGKSGGYLADGTYTISASADGYDSLSQDVTVDGADKTVTVTLFESTYSVDVLVEDSGGNAISGANVEIDGTDGANQDLTDGQYNITASADGYYTLSQDITVDGAAETVTVTLSEEEEDVIVPESSSEEEEAVIVSESSSEESGGMSTLVSASVVAFFGIFIMVVLLFGKD
jgi:hypothetical protein